MYSRLHSRIVAKLLLWRAWNTGPSSMSSFDQLGITSALSTVGFTPEELGPFSSPP